ncbi:MAG: hypothetical protein A3B86_00945 [Candidatus Yanofskybacteria bacterium RIFCSPHIGHO2_02_FULL_38_22b]|uniref:Uncharacterized protein n=1 Tax=Candidatus Yanofskybacteria bacterium RIFCSPHIGHO2_02_FULL_38_22b TaxID=1802673 RepID=A0A1F8F4Y7_9BACT|nr:MAG: hypothetical protein A3B86_00945 [Candidatus Yanofskybacteria bacterium RIFCSPHIGHO2_02_FULL_38_22b]OGN20361.1 MAG: hypothetical protein A2910_01295 [Candidatus Yanofskybacteria bacterium RIFCSPLOWO2_01_FULL_39_28]
MLSGALVVVSVIPYAIRVYQGKIETQITSWVLWALIGFALLVTYKSSGAEANVWPAVFGFTNPFIVMMLTIKRLGRNGWIKPDRIEAVCIAICVISLGLWLKLNQVKELVQYALYLAILADICSAIPTFKFVLRNPDKDRPFAWVAFAIAYGLAIFAITNHTPANYILPIWMVIGPLVIAFPMIRFRWHIRAPWKEWI